MQREESGANEQASRADLADLIEQHRALEQALQLLASRRTLTPAEQREVARLKKHKLLTKDRIARLSGGAVEDGGTAAGETATDRL